MTLRVRAHRSDSDTAQAAPVEEPDGPVVLGFPAEVEDDAGPAGPQPDPADVRLLVVRRADPAAAAAFVLAGAAASVGLWLPWTPDDATGATLVRRGLEAPGIDALVSGRFWPPVAVVVSGTALLGIGLLLFRRARTHRVAGVLALFAASPAVAGVLVLWADTGWAADRFRVGVWCAVAVAVLGVLGALKAMLTLPRVTGAETAGRSTT